MIVLMSLLIAVAVAGVAATIRAVLLDGYGRRPTRPVRPTRPLHPARSVRPTRLAHRARPAHPARTPRPVRP